MAIPDGSSGLADYACHASRAGARALAEPPAVDRSPYQRDRDRILHSVAFRRLALKTQVLLPEAGDHHRTRLTHSLEVAQIARSLARALGLDEDLTEALALAHDLGHGPFGHTGEEALEAAVAAWGGFDHNVQSLRIVVDLEQRYLDFDGLNLTWDTLEGLAKRNGPCLRPTRLLRLYDERFRLDLERQPSGEAQVAGLADDIAYSAHDLEDGLRAGFFGIAETWEVAIIRDLHRTLEVGRPALDPVRVPFALARGLINLFVADALAESRRRLREAAPADVDALRHLGHPVASLSPAMQGAAAEIKAFLFARLYRHPRLIATRARAHRVVADLAERFLAEPALMPAAWAANAAGEMVDRARVVCDYVAGMTDRHAIREYRRLFDASFDFI